MANKIKIVCDMCEKEMPPNSQFNWYKFKDISFRTCRYCRSNILLIKLRNIWALQ